MTQYNISYIENTKNFGDNLDLSEFKKWSVSKCSVGKHNNKLSLVVIPIIASLGGKIAKISDRDNEFHQSIIEKLEVIPGFCSGIPLNNFISQLRDVGISVVGNSTKTIKTDNVALNNDVVLLAYSLIAQELAKGVYNIIFDIQIGPNEPIKTIEEAQLFCDTVKLIGDSYNRKVTVFVSDLNFPIGKSVGHKFEVQEAIKILNGSITDGDFYDACLSYSSNIASVLYNVPEEIGLRLVLSTLKNGIAYKTFQRWIQTQGGDLKTLNNYSPNQKQIEILSKSNGIINIDINKLREVNRIMPNSAGIIFDRNNGDRVSSGDRICTIYANDSITIEKIKRLINQSISVSFKNMTSKNHFCTMY